MSGKGSAPRPFSVGNDTFASNWEATFGKKKKTITVYSQPNCPGCVSLKAKLQAEGKEFTEVVIGQDISREEFLQKYPGVRSVPYMVEG